MEQNNGHQKCKKISKIYQHMFRWVLQIMEKLHVIKYADYVMNQAKAYLSLSLLVNYDISSL